jgi:hypothetical protein
VASLDDARDVVERSFPTERVEAGKTSDWEPAYRRFRDYMELSGG